MSEVRTVERNMIPHCESVSIGSGKGLATTGDQAFTLFGFDLEMVSTLLALCEGIQ